MYCSKNDEPLADVLGADYGAPAPRREFAARLLRRLVLELRAAHPARRAPDLWRRNAVAAAAAAVLVAGMGLYAALTWNDAVPPEVGGFRRPLPSSTPDQAEPLNVALPRPATDGTPKHIPPHAHLEKYSKETRPALLVPAGTTNVARGRPVSGSDPSPIIGEPEWITDGDKEAYRDTHVEFGPGTQWVQIDFGRPCGIFAVVVWHYHRQFRVYHDVVVQAADDPDFIENVRTLYNNDFDNSSGLGVGRDKEYIEDYRGRLIDARGVKARYVRLYSRGNTSNDVNHYIEVEVYGRPALEPTAGGKPAEAKPSQAASG